ncbi:hypothetical protein OIU78_004207 [Salix suchowensis]|nr:hypothetical protein OIU78_004207 [Salix suchowensis]
MLMKRRGVHSGLVVKGEEGALSMTTKFRSVNASKGLPVNYCSGFRSLSMDSAFELDGVSRQNFKTEVNAKDFGFEPTDTPRTDRSVSWVCDYSLFYPFFVLSSKIVIDGIANPHCRLSRSTLFKTIDLFFTR